MAKIKPYMRHNARVLAMQALYQWLLTNNPPKEIVSYLLSTQKLKKIDVPYFEKLFLGATKHVSTIDEKMQPYLDRDITELTPVELSVLRLAVFELEHSMEVPYRVVINEALELTKEFGAEDGFKYVNGVLDKIAKGLRDLRAHEE